MSDEPDDPPGDESAAGLPEPRDRRTSERRSGADRRAATAPPPGTERRRTERRGPDRRTPPRVADLYRADLRVINEYPLDAEELEFVNALNAYKQRHHRPFPTWSEVLHVLRFLGYKKADPPGASAPVEAPVADATPEAQLRRLYDSLAELESRPSSKETEDEIRSTLALLQDLEHAEAERMRTYFESHKALDEDAAERSLERADELIRRHGHLA